MLKDKELSRIRELYDSYLVETRRHLHQNPELSDKEIQTQKFIMDQLTQMGVEHYPIARTGVVGIINGLPGGKTVGLRADIDALPMQDVKDVPYKSKNQNVSHACGHDAHTTIALGVARYFSERKDQFQGTVKLFFQPAEEAIGGAKRMVEEGCMENPTVDYVIGKHVMSYMDAGEVELKYGKLNASTDSIKITVTGTAAHGAYPDTGTDALLAACAVVQAVHTIVSRNITPLESAVISLGTIQGGTKANTICDEVVINGTMRTTSQKIREIGYKRLTETVENTAKAFGATGKVEMSPGYDALINDDEVVQIIQDVVEPLVGAENVQMKEHPSMGAEDFSFFLEKARGAFYHLGCGNKAKGITAPTHASNFDIDESCLALGVYLDVCIIERLFKS